MKTNLVKKGSEKNIEMFQMSNEEQMTITGGAMVPMVIKNEDGELIVVIVNRGAQMVTRSYRSY